MNDNWTNPDALKSSQYATEKNLSARIRVHEQFSTNPIDYTKWIFDRMLEDFPEKANIVEFGCGNGLIWTSNIHRIPAGWTITLTDLSQGMLDDAKRNLGDHADRFKFQVVDVQDSPFEDNQFDAALTNFMLYHVPDRIKAIGEIRRVLKDVGVLHSVTLGSGHMRQFHELVEQTTQRYIWNNSELVFRAENAVEQLQSHFGTVDTVPYDSDLRVTEAQPMVEYLMSSMRADNVTHDEIAKFREAFTQIISQKGEFFIQKEIVLFKSTGYTE